MTLYMTEITVRDMAVSLAWYRDTLGLRVELVDAANGFALLQCDGGGRLALKAGTPMPGGVRLHFAVTGLDGELTRLAAAGGVADGPVKVSAEGYWRAVIRDPDGYAVSLFERT